MTCKRLKFVGSGGGMWVRRQPRRIAVKSNTVTPHDAWTITRIFLSGLLNGIPEKVQAQTSATRSDAAVIQCSRIAVAVYRCESAGAVCGPVAPLSLIGL